MKSFSPTEIRKLLDKLTDEGAWFRRVAAEELALASESSLEIVQALVAATDDDNRIVRAAARQSLLAPVHQEILAQHPELQASGILGEEKSLIGIPERKFRPVPAILLGIIGAILAALPVSIVKSILAFAGAMCGIPYLGDAGWLYLVFIIVGSGLSGFLADRWKKNLWLSFLAGIVFDIVFVFVYIGQ